MKFLLLVCLMLLHLLLITDATRRQPSRRKGNNMTAQEIAERTAARRADIKKSELTTRCYFYYERWGIKKHRTANDSLRLKWRNLNKICPKELRLLPMFRRGRRLDVVRKSGLTFKCYWYFETIGARAPLKPWLAIRWEGLGRACYLELLALKPWPVSKLGPTTERKSGLSPRCHWYFETTGAPVRLRGSLARNWEELSKDCYLKFLSQRKMFYLNDVEEIEKLVPDVGLSPMCFWYIQSTNESISLSRGVSRMLKGLQSVCQGEILAMLKESFNRNVSAAEISSSGMSIQCFWYFETMGAPDNLNRGLGKFCEQELIPQLQQSFRGNISVAPLHKNGLSLQCFWFFTKMASMKRGLVPEQARTWYRFDEKCLQEAYHGVGEYMFRLSLKCYLYYVNLCHPEGLNRSLARDYDGFDNMCQEELLTVLEYKYFGNVTLSDLLSSTVSLECLWYFETNYVTFIERKWPYDNWYDSAAYRCGQQTIDSIETQLKGSSFPTSIRPRCYWYFKLATVQNELMVLSRWLILRLKALGKACALELFNIVKYRLGYYQIHLRLNVFMAITNEKEKIYGPSDIFYD